MSHAYIYHRTSTSFSTSLRTATALHLSLTSSYKMSSLPPVELMEAMSQASHDDATKLQTALISCGAALSAAALSLIVYKKAPTGGIFLHLHGGAALYLYYGFLIVFLVFGIVEATFGYWVLPRDNYGWGTIGKTMLGVSIFPLVVVAALGGFVLLK